MPHSAAQLTCQLLLQPAAAHHVALQHSSKLTPAARPQGTRCSQQCLCCATQPATKVQQHRQLQQQLRHIVICFCSCSSLLCCCTGCCSCSTGGPLGSRCFLQPCCSLLVLLSKQQVYDLLLLCRVQVTKRSQHRWICGQLL
jgi:hypothetical protein